jgi:hypothetical protein
MRFQALVLSTLALGGCSSCAGGGVTGAKSDLELTPEDANIVFKINFPRLRNTPLWRKALDQRDKDQLVKKDYDEFVTKCAFDPTKQLESLTVAVPDVKDEIGEYVLIARGVFDEPKLVACADERLKKDGNALKITEYSGKKIYGDDKNGRDNAVFLDGKTLVIAGREWVKRVIDLAAAKSGPDAPQGKSAASNKTLQNLFSRVRPHDGITGVAIVSDAARERLKSDPVLASASSMTAVLGSADLSSGLSAELRIDLANEADAKALTEKVLGQLGEAEKNPQFVLSGMGQFVKAMKIEAQQATFHLTINWTEAQVEDLINRVTGLIQLAKSRLNVQPSQPSLPSLPSQ